MTLYETVKNTCTKVMDSYVTGAVIGISLAGIWVSTLFIDYNAKQSKTRLPFRPPQRVEQKPLVVYKPKESKLEKVVKNKPIGPKKLIKKPSDFDPLRFRFGPIIGVYSSTKNNDHLKDASDPNKWTIFLDYGKKLIIKNKYTGQADDQSKKPVRPKNKKKK